MALVKSILKDERIGAYNVLIEISIGEYLAFARDVIDENEFQRRKVIKGKIKDILREDLLRNCLIPSIVLAISDKSVAGLKQDDDLQGAQTIIDNAIAQKQILIIDGLQRTFVMMGLVDDLKKTNDEEQLAKLNLHKIRAEIYLGLNRMGLLYRMITLNTGQTTMSTRHLMEILYLDYSRIGLDGIQLIKDKDEESIDQNTNVFNFKTILDGFNSYVEKKEAIIERTEILDNIRSLDVIRLEEDNKDLFKDFLLTHKLFLDTITAKSHAWSFNQAENQHSDYKINSAPFGKTALDVFKKSQAVTGFGAALGVIKSNRDVSWDDIRTAIKEVTVDDNDWHNFFAQLLKQFDLIKEKSKKIGTDQRYYFRQLFRALLKIDSEQYLNLSKASDYAFEDLRIEKNYK